MPLMITLEEIQQMVLNAFPDAEVVVEDMMGTGDHFEISVTSAAFAGKPLIEQHRLVFAVLEKEMNDRIHAVKLKTKAKKG